MRHPDQTVKIPHLVMALLFLGVAACWALLVTGVLTPAVAPYLLPGLLVGAGLLGLVALVVGSARGAAAPGTVGTTPTDDEPHAEWHDDLEHTAPLTPTKEDDR